MPDVPEIPDDFADGYPDSQRRELWLEEVEARVTDLAKQMDGEPAPTGIGQFDEAWRLLSRDRPNVDAHKCRLRRRLIRKFYEDLQALFPDLT